MKAAKNNIIHFICLIGIGFIAFSGCNLVKSKSSGTPPPPFQGPQNPSFETDYYWNFSSTNGLQGNNGASTAGITTGTGFLPTNGVRYAQLTTYNDFSPAPQATAYQDSVDFTKSSSLTFDYSISGSVGSGGGKATVAILFTANGTQTLWSQTVDGSTTFPVQQTGVTVNLPSAATTSPGRLTITLNADGGVDNSGNVQVVTQTKITFGIDNLTVK